MADEQVKIEADAGTADTGSQTASESAGQEAASQTASEAAGGASADTVVSEAAKGGGEKEVLPAANWPDDWRDKFAGEDKGFRSKLDRYADPGALAKAYRELETKLSKGELRPTLPENATDEQRAAWRKATGVPDKPENYDIKLPDGMVPGEADKPVLAEFKNMAYEKGVTPDVLNSFIGKYYQLQDQIAADKIAADQQAKIATEEALRADWGANYRSELSGIGNFLESWEDGSGALLLAATLPDGSKVGNNPAIIRSLAKLNRELNPFSSMVPGGAGDIAKAGEARIAEIKAMMGTPEGNSTYWNNPKLQQEFGDLLLAQERMKQRSAA